MPASANCARAWRSAQSSQQTLENFEYPAEEIAMALAGLPPVP
jgi:hypothetical protein